MTAAPPRAGDPLAALADAFDALAPTERAAAEQELRDAGLDPDAVAVRFAALAADGRHAGRTARRPAPAGAEVPRRRLRWAMAAAILLAIGAGWLAMRPTPDRLAHNAPRPAPRPVEPPRGLAAAPVVEDGKEPAPVAARPAGPRSTVVPQPDDGAAASRTDAESGDAIDRATADLAALLANRELLPPAVRPLVTNGTIVLRTIAVGPATIAGLQSPAFATASAANAGRFAVDAATCRLRAADGSAPPSPRFGLPFPEPAADGRALSGCQIMWNVEAAFAAGGGHRGRATLCSGEQCWDARFGSLAFDGRQTGAIDNPDRLLATSTLIAFGMFLGGDAGWLARQPLDDGTTKRWFYKAVQHRVIPVSDRQTDFSLEPGALWLAAMGRDCLGSGPESYDWKLAGGMDVLAPWSGEGIPLGESRSRGASPADGVELTLMRRPVWVVSGIERGSGGAIRVDLYVDRELYRPYWKVIHAAQRDVASFACGAAWAADGDVVAPLTSSVTRIDAESGRIDRFEPYDEVLDQRLRDVDFTVDALTRVRP